MLERAAGQAIDSSLIRQFILDQVKRFGSPEIARFLDQYFDQGMREGWWLFLFDSFDEIPDVLGSEDLSDTIDRYSQAIFGFATDFNGCRTLLATRYFRRPKDSSQPKFRILPLSDKQRNQLIGRAGLSPEGADRLYSGIAAAGPSLRSICENPMYLGLLIEYVREGADAPNNAHELFARFVDKQLDSRRDLLSRFHTDAETLRSFAEVAAFHIVAQSSLGLNPKREALLHAVGETCTDWESADPLLDLLEELRFARGESDTDDRALRRFTFSHRRFQEYFATCYVLRDRESVTENELLFDARWRETAAVLLGNSAGQRFVPILALSQQLLADSVCAITKNGQYQALETANGSDQVQAIPDFFAWPPSSLHVLSILQDGFADDPSRLPPAVRSEIASIVRSAFRRGRLEDRRIALEVSGTVRDDELTSLLRSAISFGSRVLDDIAFRQMRNLKSVPDDVSLWIRLTLLHRAARGELLRDRRTILAFLSRVPDNGRLLSAAILLSRVGLIDNGVHVLFAIAILALTSMSLDTRLLWAAWILLSPALRRACWLLYASMLTKMKASRLATNVARRPRWVEWIQHRPPSREQQFRMACYLSAVGYVLALRWLTAYFILPLRSAADFFLCAGWLFLGGWAPMATAAVAEGNLTSPRWWPFLTFYPLLRVAAQPLTSVRAVGRHLRRHGSKYVVIATLLLLERLLLLDGNHRGTNRALLVFALTYIPLGVGAITAIVWWCADCRRFWRFQNSASEIAPADFVSALGSYRLNSFRIRFIRLVAGNLLLPHNDRSIEMIRNLSLALDRDLSRGPGESALPTGLPTVDQWRNRYIERSWWNRKLGLKRWGNAVLDELSGLEQRLVEQQRITKLPAGSSTPSLARPTSADSK
jgi:hypothetical protein